MRRGKKHNSATAQETGPALSVELLALRLLLVQDMKEMVETTIGNALESFKKSLELLEASTGGHRKCLTELETGGFARGLLLKTRPCSPRRWRLRTGPVDSTYVTNIDEKYLEGQNATQFMSKFFTEVLGDVFPTPSVLDITHQIGPLCHDAKSRVMIVKFHCLQDKVKCLAAKHNQLDWCGEKVRFFADYSPPTSKQCTSYATVKLLLFNKKVTFRLVYPAVLFVEHENQM